MPGTVRIGLLDRFQAVKAGGLICPWGSIKSRVPPVRVLVCRGDQSGLVRLAQVSTTMAWLLAPDRVKENWFVRMTGAERMGWT